MNIFRVFWAATVLLSLSQAQANSGIPVESSGQATEDQGWCPAAHDEAIRDLVSYQQPSPGGAGCLSFSDISCTYETASGENATCVAICQATCQR